MLVSYTFQIDDFIKDRIEEIAKLENRSLAAQMRIVTTQYVEKLSEQS